MSSAFDDQAAQWLDEWSGSIEQQAAKAQAMSDRVARLTATASSRDGAVQVTVGSSGALTGLRLGEAVRKWPADEIAAQILTVMRQAQASLTAQVADVAADTVGADSPAGRAVVSSFAQRYPVPEADDDVYDDASATDWRHRGR